MKNTKHDRLRDDVATLMNSIADEIFGLEHVTELILIALICNDHVLLEDVPGTGKTQLVKTIAHSLDLNVKRVQGTPDLLPTDVTGVNVFDQSKQELRFVPGPLFTNFLIFDEINRASPKTQSALLEAMAEHQISVDNITYILEKPFFVVATQNPYEHVGTYELPLAQLDRFLFCSSIGYPNRETEKKIITHTHADLSDLKKLNVKTIFNWQKDFSKVFIKDELLDSILNMVNKTRNNSQFSLGISPRATKKFITALKARAYIYSRDFVTRGDVDQLFLPVFNHRVLAAAESTEQVVLKKILEEEPS